MRRGQPALPGPKWEEFEALVARARKALDAAKWADQLVHRASADAEGYTIKKPYHEPVPAHAHALEAALNTFRMTMIADAGNERCARFIDAADELREVRRLLLAAACEAVTDLTNFEFNLRIRADG